MAAAVCLALLNPIFCAWADGTEGLGAPIGIDVQAGSGIVASGTGLVSQPGFIDINVPGSVKQVLLFWEGQSVGPIGDNTITVNGQSIAGTSIGGPTLFFRNIYSTTFRADITHLNLVSPGANSLTVQGLNFGHANNGAGIMVIFDDGKPAFIQIRDGNDLAFINLPSPLNSTNPQTFTFASDTSTRSATLPMFFSSVEGSVSGGSERPSAIEVTVNGKTTVYDNLLFSNDGDEWDTIKIPVTIPPGANSLTVQALSKDNLGTGHLPASFAWNAAGLAISENVGQGEGCTPGYWKQKQHFDSWTAPYTPYKQFSSVFKNNAFPGKTLLQVLKLRGGGLSALGRHSVAALLNAASSKVSYDLTVSEVIGQFNEVYPGTKSQYNTVKDIFADFNEQGCPLN